MANTNFIVKNGLSYTGYMTVNSSIFTYGNSTTNSISINATALTFGNSTTNVTINSTAFSGNVSPATNAFTVGTAVYFVTNGNVGFANASPTNTLSVNGTTYLGGNVGLANASPTNTLSVNGTTYLGGNVTINTGTLSITANLQNQTLTDGSTISWNLASGSIANVTLAGNRTLANPTNLNVGTSLLTVIQDGTGSRTLAYGTVYKWPAGTAPVLTTAAGSKDIISFFCDGTNMYGSFLPDVR